MNNIRLGLFIALVVIVGIILRGISSDGFQFMKHSISRFTPVDHPKYGHVYVLDTDDLISKFIIDKDVWEEDLCRKMADNYVPGTDMVDIGANMGLNTLLMHKMKPVTGKVHLFEPQFDCFTVLEYNTRDIPREIYNLCLSDTYDMLSYNKVGDNVGGTSMTQNPTVNQIKVAAVPLDTIKFDNRVSLVKIDVEGAERFVLQGGRKFFETHKPALVIEIWEDKRAEVMHVLQSMNYVMVEKLGGHDFLFKHASTI